MCLLPEKSTSQTKWSPRFRCRLNIDVVRRPEETLRHRRHGENTLLRGRFVQVCPSGVTTDLCSRYSTNPMRKSCNQYLHYATPKQRLR